jgi:hypothetical protein
MVILPDSAMQVVFVTTASTPCQFRRSDGLDYHPAAGGMLSLCNEPAR